MHLRMAMRHLDKPFFDKESTFVPLLSGTYVVGNV